MIENANKVRELIFNLPVNSVIYIDALSDDDKAKLGLERIQLTSIEGLFKSYLMDYDAVSVENNVTWQDITKKYQEVFASYTATLYFNLSEALGEDILIPLYDPIYEIGYDNISEKIYIYKSCPLHKI